MPSARHNRTIAPSKGKVFRVIDTSYDSPLDILETGMEEMLQNQQNYVILSRSAVVLISRNV